MPTLSRLMWFGTEKRMRMIATPLGSSEYSNVNRAETETLLNGGGWARGSWTSHKEFNLSWGARDREQTQVIKDYADGLYGDGPFFFVDPMAEWINLLPAWWAAPAMGTLDAPSLLPGVTPERVNTPDNSDDYPIYSAKYNVTTSPNDDSGKYLFVPVPPDSVMAFGVHGSRTGTAEVRVRGVRKSGSLGPRRDLRILPVDSGQATSFALLGTEYVGARIYITRRDNTPSTITLSGLVARRTRAFDPNAYPYLIENMIYQTQPTNADTITLTGTRQGDVLLVDVPAVSAAENGGFVGGRGNSGVAFASAVIESPVTGRPDQSTIAAKLTEVGGWLPATPN